MEQVSPSLLRPSARGLFTPKAARVNSSRDPMRRYLLPFLVAFAGVILFAHGSVAKAFPTAWAGSQASMNRIPPVEIL